MLSPRNLHLPTPHTHRHAHPLTHSQPPNMQPGCESVAAVHQLRTHYTSEQSDWEQIGREHQRFRSLKVFSPFETISCPESKIESHPAACFMSSSLESVLQWEAIWPLKRQKKEFIFSTLLCLFDEIRFCWWSPFVMAMGHIKWSHKLMLAC